MDRRLGVATAKNQYSSQLSGTILEIPVKEGDQVIQVNNLTNGLPLLRLQDLSIMIFEGK